MTWIEWHETLGKPTQTPALYRTNANPKERIGRMIERLGLEYMEEALGLGSDA